MTHRLVICCPDCINSIRALHMECDKIRDCTIEYVGEFQSTHSIQSATPVWLTRVSWTTYFNPRTPYRVRLTGEGVPPMTTRISIHALHTECDLM
ncbi:hypothetical protein SAMN05428987_5149 [Paenibacillus sp. CF095]|nr:hypothetical protein SAMN05428987_5149 [Paenibacillus sp. CF095]